MKRIIALVTGGTRGIGRAISLELAEKGMIVFSGYLENDEEAKFWKKKLVDSGINNIHLFKADTASPDIMEKINRDIIKNFNKIDILINNVGITRNVLFQDMTFDEWDKVIKTNLNSLFFVTRPVLASMIRNNFGRVINISSVNGQKGQAREVNYSTTKAGIRGFTKALAQEVADKNITVNTVSPGYIDTELTKTLSSKEIEKILAKVPLKRLGTPKEIARLVSFLAESNSGFITGADFSINGGLYML